MAFYIHETNITCGYTVIHEGCKTMLGTKRKAIKNVPYQSDITIYEDNTPKCYRSFWQQLSLYGWDKWRAYGSIRSY